jgi:signal transduction histidine kinase
MPARIQASRLIVWSGVILASATGVAVVLAQFMLTPPRRDLVELGVYLAVSGAITVAIGWLLIRLFEGRFGLTLLSRFALVTLVGNAVLVANIVVLARLMFISTDHDLQVLLATVAFSTVIAVCFTTWVASQAIARIANVNQGIRDLAAGNLSITTDVSGHDEVATLAEDVQALARRLTEARDERLALDAERRELTAAISHDLRTPLSTIRAMVDALEDGVVSEPVEMKRYFVTIRRDVERLNRMIDDLFDLAQMDAGAMRLRRQSITVHEVVSEVVDAMRARAERADVAIELSIQDELPAAMLDGDRLERAIANLLRNALEHTPSGGRVHVLVSGDGAHASVEISDTGEGIAEADLPNIWTRFYRAERSRARAGDASDGAGLGLAITKGIVELHGGQVQVRSRPGAGSVFTVVLPIEGELDV